MFLISFRNFQYYVTNNFWKTANMNLSSIEKSVEERRLVSRFGIMCNGYLRLTFCSKWRPILFPGDFVIYAAAGDNRDDCVIWSRDARGIIYQWPRAKFIEREATSTNSTPWDLSFSSRLVSCARIGQEYVLSRQRINYRESRARRARRKKEKEEEESAGRKEKRLAARDVGWTLFDGHLLLVAHQRIPTSPLCSVHSRPTTLFLSSSFSFSRFAPLLSWRTLLHPPLRAIALVCSVTSCFFHVRGSEKDAGESRWRRNDKFIICTKSKVDFTYKSRAYLILASPLRVTLLN